MSRDRPVPFPRMLKRGILLYSGMLLVQTEFQTHSIMSCTHTLFKVLLVNVGACNNFGKGFGLHVLIPENYIDP